jgi:erythrin-vacuolar iron transport family protein
MNDAINFSSISLKDALDLAIMIEDEARDRYLEFADQMELHHTENAAKFFRFMADNEARHGEELRERRLRLFGDEPVDVEPNTGYEIEAPEYQEAKAFMSAREAMEVALSAEEKAWAFFDRALGFVKEPDIRLLFEELREEEVEHQELVREEIDRLPPERAVDPEDYVDPPVQQ